MALPNRLLFDIIEDRIFDVIAATRDAQVVIDPNVYFNVVKELTTSIQQSKLPLVNVIFITETDNSETTQKKHQGVDITFDIEMYVSVPQEGTESADVLSAKRLYYLAAQVKQALTTLIETDLGFDPGIISKRRFSTFQRFRQFQSENENIMVSGKFTFIVGASFDSDDYDLLDLEEIAVDAALFSYTYKK